MNTGPDDQALRDRRALEAVTGHPLNGVWPADAMQPGTRIRVLKDPAWAGPWKDVFTGTVDETMVPRDVQSAAARAGEREYSVAFDEPQLDSDGGGPYRKGVIWDRYLEEL